jgi:hypothetical protein
MLRNQPGDATSIAGFRGPANPPQTAALARRALANTSRVENEARFYRDSQGRVRIFPDQTGENTPP